MSQIDKDRFFNMAACYDAVAPYLVPCYQWLQEQVIDLLFADGRTDKLLVDLGAGSGIFLDRVLARYPDAQALWVDYSNDFLAVARNRLAGYGSRVQFVCSTLQADWETQVGQAPDAICSMSAIHHLPSQEKRRLYERCHNLLKPGGWFFNTDEMRADDDDAYLNTLRYWVRHVDRMAPRVPADLQEQCRAWCEKFEGWKTRNIIHRDHAKLPGDDIHDRYNEQVDWLRQIGYADVDLFAKSQLWCVIGGRRR